MHGHAMFQTQTCSPLLLLLRRHRTTTPRLSNSGTWPDATFVPINSTFLACLHSRYSPTNHFARYVPGIHGYRFHSRSRTHHHYNPRLHPASLLQDYHQQRVGWGYNLSKLALWSTSATTSEPLKSNLGEILEREFHLTSWDDLQPPRPLGIPVFGLKILPDALYFCSRRGHGYSTEATLSSHQRGKDCPRPADGVDKQFRAYGQSYGFTTSTFSVDDLDHFFQREHWADHLAGKPPVEINKLVAVPADSEHPHVERLRVYLVEYLSVVQKYIGKHLSHGLMRRMAQIGVTENSNEFRELLKKSLVEYSRELVALLINSIEQVRGATTSTYYPFNPEQNQALLDLHTAMMRPNSRPETIAPVLHHVVFLLLAQEKEHGGVSFLQLPAVTYLVARSYGKTEWIRTSEIGRAVAKMMWLVRATVLYEMEKVMKTEKLRSMDAYNRFKKFLVDGEDTVMAYLYNISALIKSIRGEEYTDAHSQMEDVHGRQLRFHEDLIDLDTFGTMQNELRDEYRQLIAKKIFFDKPIPEWFTRAIDVPALVDDPRNNSAGYCLIDNPRNGFTEKFVLYGQWLLSCPKRAAQFTENIDGQLVRKSAPCYTLLQNFSKLRSLLCTRKIAGVGPSVRASEIARDLLRNLSGAAIRSLLILFHNLCIVGVQDKLSHKILKKRFTPGAPDSETAEDLIRNLVFFRRFESNLIRHFKGDFHAERYNMYLWPDINANMTGDQISENLGDETERFIGTRLQILEYRGVATAFMRFHMVDFAEDSDADNHYDLLSNHSSRTSHQRYGVDRATLASAPTGDIIGCLQTTIKWQELTGIKADKALSLTAPGLGKVLLPDIAAETDSGGGLSRTDVVTIVQETMRANELQVTRRFKDTLTGLFADLAATYFPAPPPPPAPHALRAISSVLVDPSRLLALRNFLRDDNASFHCPEQGELVEKMNARKKHILAVLPCDFGKTTMILFLAKMYDPHLVTMVILPLSGLHRDFFRRAADESIATAEYDPAHPELLTAVSVLCVSVEHAVDDAFIKYSQKLVQQRRLARIVIDEAHIPVTSQHYREPMLKLIKILGVETHITALSGTFPPHIYADWCQLTGIREWDIVRMPTQRANIAYGVIICPPAAYKQKAVEYVQNRPKTTDYTNTDDKIMVFCRTRAVAEDIAELLGTTAYHSRTELDKCVEIFDDWTHNRTRVIACTSVLGAGVNQPVKDVVHVDLAWDLINQVQEAFRGGRNGTPARSVYFVPEKRPALLSPPGCPFGAELLVPWALDQSTCRRLPLSLFLDGVGITCLTMQGRNVQLCDNCRMQAFDSLRVPPAVPIPTPTRTASEPGAARWMISAAPIPRSRAPPMPPRPGAVSLPEDPQVPLAQNVEFDADDESERDVFGVYVQPAPIRPSTPPAEEAPPPSPGWDPFSTTSLMAARGIAARPEPKVHWVQPLRFNIPPPSTPDRFVEACRAQPAQFNLSQQAIGWLTDLAERLSLQAPTYQVSQPSFEFSDRPWLQGPAYKLSIGRLWQWATTANKTIEHYLTPMSDFNPQQCCSQHTNPSPTEPNPSAAVCNPQSVGTSSPLGRRWNLFPDAEFKGRTPVYTAVTAHAPAPGLSVQLANREHDARQQLCKAALELLKQGCTPAGLAGRVSRWAWLTGLPRLAEFEMAGAGLCGLGLDGLGHAPNSHQPFSLLSVSAPLAAVVPLRSMNTLGILEFFYSGGCFCRAHFPHLIDFFSSTSSSAFHLVPGMGMMLATCLLLKWFVVPQGLGMVFEIIEGLNKPVYRAYKPILQVGNVGLLRN
ncbi:hypothetical protein DFH07DRAFT_1009590 [Mycena maculata]|uniref:DNA 3'-5' helicase n=1 Tax=Mycena maculata TaxID=230809 RepID=A0AAD7HGW9_9AGAR|nr:hypothetical protein DFH07DRAFT_1009590 [Mycena maculata]